jgi:hypothetical protein
MMCQCHGVTDRCARKSTMDPPTRSPASIEALLAETDESKRRTFYVKTPRSPADRRRLVSFVVIATLSILGLLIFLSRASQSTLRVVDQEDALPTEGLASSILGKELPTQATTEMDPLDPSFFLIGPPARTFRGLNGSLLTDNTKVHIHHRQSSGGI